MENRAIDYRVAIAIAEMERRIAEPTEIDDLARFVNLSMSRFTHLFREQTGSTPRRYLRDLRLERARLLLERTSLPIAEVMLLVGCVDASHFATDFRRRFGATPHDFRRIENALYRRK